jgi:hypothetical protein
MVIELCDYSFSPPSIGGLVGAGIKGAGRYVGPGSQPKHLTARERDALLAAGLCIWLLVEGAAKDALSGASVGAYHGRLCASEAQSLGAPRGAVLVGNVDWDVSAAEWPAVAAYFRAYAGPVRTAGYRVGLYGGLNAIEWAARDGLADILMQTYGWSTRLVGNVKKIVWSTHSHIQQYRNGVKVGGGDIDLCRAVVDNFGQWPIPAAPTKGENVSTIWLVVNRGEVDGHEPGTEFWSDGTWYWPAGPKGSLARSNEAYVYLGRWQESKQWAADGPLRREVRAGAIMGTGPYALPYDPAVLSLESIIGTGALPRQLAAGGLVPHTHTIKIDGETDGATAA